MKRENVTDRTALAKKTPPQSAGELNVYTLNLADLRLFIVDCIKEGKTEIPLGDFIFACKTFATKHEE